MAAHRLALCASSAWAAGCRSARRPPPAPAAAPPAASSAASYHRCPARCCLAPAAARCPQRRAWARCCRSAVASSFDQTRPAMLYFERTAGDTMKAERDGGGKGVWGIDRLTFVRVVHYKLGVEHVFIMAGRHHRRILGAACRIWPAPGYPRGMAVQVEPALSFSWPSSALQLSLTELIAAQSLTSPTHLRRAERHAYRVRCSTLAGSCARRGSL